MVFNAIVELGKATHLTLGVGVKGNESRQRPFGCWNSEKNEAIVSAVQVIELGDAAKLTLGFGSSRWETSSRPNSRD